MPRNVYFGDGTPIPDEVVARIGDLYEELCVEPPWEAGDLIALDNMLVAHARRPFSGERKILVAMAEMVDAKELAPLTCEQRGHRESRLISRGAPGAVAARGAVGSAVQVPRQLLGEYLDVRLVHHVGVVDVRRHDRPDIDAAGGEVVPGRRMRVSLLLRAEELDPDIGRLRHVPHPGEVARDQHQIQVTVGNQALEVVPGEQPEQARPALEVHAAAYPPRDAAAHPLGPAGRGPLP